MPARQDQVRPLERQATLIQRTIRQLLAQLSRMRHLSPVEWLMSHGTESRLTNHADGHGNKSFGLQSIPEGLG